jgi:molybdopterin converting factor small subunit
MTETLPRDITLTVQFLARYAELVGTASTTVTLRTPATVGHVMSAVRSRFPGARQIPLRPLCAVNLAQAELSTPVTDGDVLALLPPVAGG